MTSDFKDWKKKHGMVQGKDQKIDTPRPTSSLVNSTTSGQSQGITKEALGRLDGDYLAQVAFKRGQMSRAPSSIGSVRSSMSSASMIERLAQVETALTTMTKHSQHQAEKMQKLEEIALKQDRLLTMLADRVIGETIQPSDSASQS